MTEKITNYEQEVKDLIATADSASKNGSSVKRPEPDADGLRNDEEAADDDDDRDDTDAASDTSDDEFEDRFVELEEDLANVIADVHDMGQFPLRFESAPMLTRNGRPSLRSFLASQLHGFHQDCQEARCRPLSPVLSSCRPDVFRSGSV